MNVCRRASLLLVALGLVACQPKIHVDNPSPFEEDDPAAQPDDSDESEVSPEQPDEAPLGDGPNGPRGRRLIEVDRETYASVLARGPGVFLRGVEIIPYFRGDRFDGWEIVQFLPGDDRFDDIDLLPGDIIGRINGRLIARPPHLLSLWSELAKATSVVVDIRRTGENFELRVDVVDATGAEPVPPEPAP